MNNENTTGSDSDSADYVPRARRGQTNGRPSRDQESREAIPLHEEPVDFSAQGPLPDVKPRPGYAQRWIRVRKGGEHDAQNMYAATRRGWVPRDPKTVPASLQYLTVQREGTGGCIGTHDSVLMERPLAISQREAEGKRRDRRDREQAVRENLFAEFKGARKAGFSDPSTEGSGSRVERGRAPSIQDD